MSNPANQAGSPLPPAPSAPAVLPPAPVQPTSMTSPEPIQPSPQMTTEERIAALEGAFKSATTKEDLEAVRVSLTTLEQSLGGQMDSRIRVLKVELDIRFEGVKGAIGSLRKDMDTKFNDVDTKLTKVSADIDALKNAPNPSPSQTPAQTGPVQPSQPPSHAPQPTNVPPTPPPPVQPTTGKSGKIWSAVIGAVAIVGIVGIIALVFGWLGFLNNNKQVSVTAPAPAQNVAPSQPQMSNTLIIEPPSTVFTMRQDPPTEVCPPPVTPPAPKAKKSGKRPCPKAGAIPPTTSQVTPSKATPDSPRDSYGQKTWGPEYTARWLFDIPQSQSQTAHVVYPQPNVQFPGSMVNTYPVDYGYSVRSDGWSPFVSGVVVGAVIGHNGRHNDRFVCDPPQYIPAARQYVRVPQRYVYTPQQYVNAGPRYNPYPGGQPPVTRIVPMEPGTGNGPFVQRNQHGGSFRRPGR